MKKQTAKEMPYEAKIWRYALLDAAHAVEQAILKPPARTKGETLAAYVRRSRAIVDKHLAEWQKANAEMHAALQRGGE